MPTLLTQDLKAKYQLFLSSYHSESRRDEVARITAPQNSLSAHYHSAAYPRDSADLDIDGSYRRRNVPPQLKDDHIMRLLNYSGYLLAVASGLAVFAVILAATRKMWTRLPVNQVQGRQACRGFCSSSLARTIVRLLLLLNVALVVSWPG